MAMPPPNTALITSGTLLAEAQQRAERLLALSRVVLSLSVLLIILVMQDVAAEMASPTIQQQIAHGLRISVVLVPLSLLTLWFCAPRRYTPAIAWIATTLDIAVMLAVAVASHTTTGLPANQTFAMPPIWFIPLLLAVSALRLNPALSIYLVTACTVLLPLFTIGIAPLQNQITAEQMELLTEQFFVPAYIFRLFLLAATGSLIILAVYRSRALLRESVHHAVVRDRAGRFLPSALLRLLEKAPDDGIRFGRRQPLVVMFCDIRGFTLRAEGMEPLALTAFLGEFRARISRVAGAHGGVIDKFVGDNVMLLFGAVDFDPDRDRRNALACASAILEEVAAWNHDLVADGDRPVRIGIGVHAGEAFCGTIGDAERLEFTVLGDAVNVASRLESECKTLQAAIVASDSIVQDLTLPGWQDEGERSLRGRSAPMRLWVWREDGPFSTSGLTEAVRS